MHYHISPSNGITLIIQILIKYNKFIVTTNNKNIREIFMVKVMTFNYLYFKFIIIINNNVKFMYFIIK